MKSILVYAALSMGIMFSSQVCLADCLISVRYCPSNPAIPRTPFADSYQGSDIDSNRCLKRAREWQVYCRVPPFDGVGAYFFTSSGVPVVAMGVVGDSKILYSTDKSSSRWIPLNP